MTRSEWDHDALAADLAAHLRAESVMVWQDMQLGPAGSPRPDVFTIHKSFMRPNPRAYEVKISRADLRADVTSGKWQCYLNYAASVTFALPLGLASKDEIPAAAGLIVRGETGWRAARRPMPGAVNIPEQAWLKLLIDGVEREGQRARARRWVDMEGRFIQQYKQFGEDAAKWVANRAEVEAALREAPLRAQRILDDAKRQAERFTQEATEQAPQRWVELCAVLGLPVESSRWAVADAVQRVRVAAEGGVAKGQLRSLRVSLDHAMTTIDRMLAAAKDI